MGDYSNGEPIGKHVKLYSNGEIEIMTYWFDETCVVEFHLILIYLKLI